MHCMHSHPLARGKKECSFFDCHLLYKYKFVFCEIQIPLNGNVFVIYLLKSNVSALDNICIEVIKDNSLEN